MAKAYSLDLRERVAARVVAGEPVRAAGVAFSASASSAVRWPRRLRATGGAARAKADAPRPRALDGQRGWLLKRLADEPSAALLASDQGSWITGQIIGVDGGRSSQRTKG